MAGSSAIPRPPAGLAERGRSLWREVQRGYELDPVETQLLVELCRALDCCDRIRAELKGVKSLLVHGSVGQWRGSIRCCRRWRVRRNWWTGWPLVWVCRCPALRVKGISVKAARTRWSRAAKAAPVRVVGALMARHRDGGEDVPPPGLVVFDGREFCTAAAWEDAFDAWCDARECWETAHPGADLPRRVLSDCPFDDALPHAGVWARSKGEDVMRCAEHDLPPERH